MNKNNPSKSIRINFKNQEQESIKFLMKQFAKDTEHDLIRFLISKVYIEQKENDLKYGSNPVKKETYADRVLRLKAMSLEELEAYLLSVGYMEEDHNDPDDSDIILRNRIIEENNIIKFYQERYSKSRSKIEYSRELHENIESLIKGLTKEKLI